MPTQNSDVINSIGNVLDIRSWQLALFRSDWRAPKCVFCWTPPLDAERLTLCASFLEFDFGSFLEFDFGSFLEFDFGTCLCEGCSTCTHLTKKPNRRMKRSDLPPRSEDSRSSKSPLQSRYFTRWIPFMPISTPAGLRAKMESYLPPIVIPILYGQVKNSDRSSRFWL